MSHDEDDNIELQTRESSDDSDTDHDSSTDKPPPSSLCVEAEIHIEPLLSSYSSPSVGNVKGANNKHVEINTSSVTSADVFDDTLWAGSEYDHKQLKGIEVEKENEEEGLPIMLQTI